MNITKSKSEWKIEGGEVRLQVAEGLNTWGVDIEVRNGRGWKLVCGSERDRTALTRNTLVTGAVLREGRWPRLFSQSPEKVVRGKGKATLVLEGKCGSHEITHKLTVFDSESRIHVDTECRLHGTVRVASLGTPYVFLPDGMSADRYDKPDFLWIPTLRKSPEHVVADQIFRAPAAIVQKGGFYFSIVPDLDVLTANRPLPACLDLQLENETFNAPWLWYGFKTYKVDGHAYYKHTPEHAPKLRNAELKYSYDILVSGNAHERSAHRDAMRFLWGRYGKRLARKIEPQTIPFDGYAKHACNFAFETGGIYHEFDVEGTPVSGTIAATFASERVPALMGAAALKASIAASRLLPVFHGFAMDSLMNTPAASDILELYLHKNPPPVAPLVMLQAWFNNLRTAYGFFSFAERWDDADIRARALKMKELAIAAPAEDGIWKSLCYFPDGNPKWFEGSRAFESVRYYHIPDNAWTGVWMLNWYEDLERDERLLKKAAGLGDFILRAQLPSGAIPPWVKVSDGKITPKSTLRESAQTAAPAMFLARLAEATGEMGYLCAANRAATFIINSVLPENKWWDFETFFSCSKKDKDMRDAGAGLHCMNNLCIFWSAELMRLMHRATAERRFLDAGLRIVDTLCLWQQVWDAPYISINTFGGFGVMNTDAEWNDARQSMFAECLAGYFDLTGEPEYFERSVAALRASFTTMLCPENRPVAPGNLRRLRAKDFGATYENYAHFGFDRGVNGYVMFDWGSGGALAAVARARRSHGDIFIHAPTESVFGIDCCTASGLKISRDVIEFRLSSPKSPARPMKIVAQGLKRGKYNLVINRSERGEFSNKNLEDGITLEI